MLLGHYTAQSICHYIYLEHDIYFFLNIYFLNLGVIVWQREAHAFAEANVAEGLLMVVKPTTSGCRAEGHLGRSRVGAMARGPDLF